MISIGFERVSKSYKAEGRGSITALARVDLAIKPGELFFLLGPSGCGKTTALRLLAGLETPDVGRILFGERAMNDVPAHRRAVGMVFQSYALWPHLSVFENVAYGLRVRKLAGQELDGRVNDALALVKMSEYAEAQPAQLSGGQQQRVALARALVIKPEVLILDEPLSNLDARLRAEMRAEIRALHEAAAATTVYVTHDQEEALSMADRIAVLRAGRIEQVGNPLELYRRPRSRFVAEFLGQTNFIPAKAAGSVRNGLADVETPLGRFRVVSPAEEINDKNKLTVVIRPERISVSSGEEDGKISLSARLVRRTFSGDKETARLETQAGIMIEARFRPGELKDVKENDTLSIAINSEDIFLLVEE